MARSTLIYPLAEAGHDLNVALSVSSHEQTQESLTFEMGDEGALLERQDVIDLYNVLREWLRETP